MISFTQHNPSTCITHDDLEGLLSLYPDCTHAITEPVCYKIEHFIGWLRLGIFVLIPVLVAMLVAIILASVTQQHQMRRLTSAKNLLRAKSRGLHQANARADHNLRKAREMQSDLELQKATEDARVQEEARKLSQVYIQSANAFSSAGKGGKQKIPRLKTGRSRTSSDDSGTFRWLAALKGLATPRTPRSGNTSPSVATRVPRESGTTDGGGGVGLGSPSAGSASGGSEGLFANMGASTANLAPDEGHGKRGSCDFGHSVSEEV